MKKGYSLLDAVLAVALVGIIAAMLLPALFSLNKIVSRENTNLDILEACKSQMEREIAAQYSDTIPVRDDALYDFQVFINPVGELNEIKLICRDKKTNKEVTLYSTVKPGLYSD